MRRSKGRTEGGSELSCFVFLEDVVFEIGVPGCEIVEEYFASTDWEAFHLFLTDSDFKVGHYIWIEIIEETEVRFMR